MSRFNTILQDRDTQLHDKRQQLLVESYFDPYKPRYGLFSYPGNLAIADDSYNKKQPINFNPDGTVGLRPKNFQIGIPRKGKTTDVYFSAPEFHTVGDRYKDPEKPYKYEFDRTQQMMSFHNQAFRPSGKSKSNPHFEYISDPLSQVPNRRTQNGVMTGPKNFMTSQMKRGGGNNTPGVTIGAYPAHIGDPYDRKQEMLKQQRQKHREKILGGPFKNMNHGNQNFTGLRDTYSEEDCLAQKDPRPATYDGAKHCKPWMPNNPAKRGIYDKTIGRFPEYVDIGPDQLRYRRTEGIWKYTYNRRSEPSPTVHGNFRNPTSNNYY